MMINAEVKNVNGGYPNKEYSTPRLSVTSIEEDVITASSIDPFGIDLFEEENAQ